MDRSTSSPLVLFSHGQMGTPDGTKIRRLATLASQLGCQIESLDYRHQPDPDQRADTLKRHINQLPAGLPLILVGSSMGAYISLVASQQRQPIGLFLLAPALCLPGYRHQDPTPHTNQVTLIHGWQDEVVPVAHVINFSQRYRLNLHLVDADHRLLSAMAFIEKRFTQFLEELLSERENPSRLITNPSLL
ncbi:MAG: alpha/beta hydrolase [Magnetococcales bacterium]|nr:alpha/beta hydrolase [Magnetococcales bacterium]